MRKGDSYAMNEELIKYIVALINSDNFEEEVKK